ncbi:BCP1 family protein [Kipferlia bialata]|uniref:BCP1 family protein n=1 Tax=Kipferlia bialata TaxID=797122 RepID=A0A9K3GMZ5_9EUKA|nr:BCP1 family protein [Kipferlia bialata]|eukprot:g10517.t1
MARRRNRNSRPVAPVVPKASKRSREAAPEEEAEPDFNAYAGQGTGEVQDMSFDVADPKEAHYFGVRTLFMQSYPHPAFQMGARDVADLITNQPEVGGVLVSEESEDPLGFLSVLSVPRYSAVPGFANIMAFLTAASHMAGPEAEAQFTG